MFMKGIGSEQVEQSYEGASFGWVLSLFPIYNIYRDGKSTKVELQWQMGMKQEESSLKRTSQSVVWINVSIIINYHIKFKNHKTADERSI